MAWLGTWAKRIEITVSNTEIDSDLTHFPLLLTLGSSVGTGNDDVTAIFDELGSDANRLKIAVTESDGTTEINVEIDEWDDASETAYLWVASSGLTLSSSGTTTLYIYYDSSQPDNTTNVGDTNDVAAEGVWDSNFQAVWHMSDGASSSAIYDSTSNDEDGTKDGANAPNEVAGHIGQEQDFNGSSDWIDIGDSTTMDGATTGTWEAWLIMDSWSGGSIIRKWTGGGQSYLFVLRSSDEIGFAVNDGSSFLNTETTNANLSTGTRYHVVVQWNGGNDAQIIIDGTTFPTMNDIVAGGPGAIANVAENLALGARYNGGSTDIFFDGHIDEARMSDTNRSDAWVKATYHSGNDNLVSYGAQEVRRRRIIIS